MDFLQLNEHSYLILMQWQTLHFLWIIYFLKGPMEHKSKLDQWFGEQYLFLRGFLFFVL